MVKYVFIALSLLFATAAHAQQQPFASNPQEQIERTIGNLFIANTNLTSQVQSLQVQLAETQKQLAEEKAKNVPKTEAPK